MNTSTRMPMRELNPHLLCVLCGGYLVDATTIIECIHSFCRTCIVRYLESSKYCPICDVQVHKTRPLLNVRSDKTLQTLVYKLVPGLFKNEMKRRRDFYASNPEASCCSSSTSINADEERGELREVGDVNTNPDDEKISLCLQYSDRLPSDKNEAVPDEKDPNPIPDCRFLLCPSAVTVAHLKKFIRLKFDLLLRYRVEIFCSDEALRDCNTLLDVAHMYGWRRCEPLQLFYVVADETVAKLHLTPPSVKSRSEYYRSPGGSGSGRQTVDSTEIAVISSDNQSEADEDKTTAEAGSKESEPVDPGRANPDVREVESDTRLPGSPEDRPETSADPTPGHAQGVQDAPVITGSRSDGSSSQECGSKRRADESPSGAAIGGSDVHTTWAMTSADPGPARRGSDADDEDEDLGTSLSSREPRAGIRDPGNHPGSAAHASGTGDETEATDSSVGDARPLKPTALNSSRTKSKKAISGKKLAKDRLKRGHDLGDVGKGAVAKGTKVTWSNDVLHEVVTSPKDKPSGMRSKKHKHKKKAKKGTSEKKVPKSRRKVKGSSKKVKHVSRSASSLDAGNRLSGGNASAAAPRGLDDVTSEAASGWSGGAQGCGGGVRADDRGVGSVAPPTPSASSSSEEGKLKKVKKVVGICKSLALHSPPNGAVVKRKRGRPPKNPNAQAHAHGLGDSITLTNGKSPAKKLKLSGGHNVKRKKSVVGGRERLGVEGAPCRLNSREERVTSDSKGREEDSPVCGNKETKNSRKGLTSSAPEKDVTSGVTLPIAAHAPGRDSPTKPPTHVCSHDNAMDISPPVVNGNDCVDSTRVTSQPSVTGNDAIPGKAAAS